MSKRKPNIAHGTVGRIVERALRELAQNHLEEAMQHALQAVDVTAARIYRHTENRKRFTAFLRDNIDLIFCVMAGSPIKGLFFGGKPASESEADRRKALPLEDVIYDQIRCGLMHEGALDEEEVRLTSLGQTPVIGGFKPIVIPRELVIGVIGAVVGAQANERERTANEYRLGPIEVNNFWGRKDRIMEAFRRPID